MLKQTLLKRELFRHTPSRRGAILLVLGVAFLIGLGTNLARPAQTAAATNSTINFQARLETSSGSIVPDGWYNVEFKLYNVASGGSAQWTEDYTWNNGSSNCTGAPLGSGDCRVQVINGYLTANLGSITSFPSTINWDQQEWLTMNIGGTVTSGSYPAIGDGEMSPRLALTAVPYAFTAGQLASTVGSNRGTLSFNTTWGQNTSIVLPDPGTTTTQDVCYWSSASCGFAPTTGGSGYIQLQGSTPGVQQTGNFNINGTGIAVAGLQTALLDTPVGTTTLNVGTNNATTGIDLNQSVVVASGKSLTLTGGNTASRPGSPTKGMLYFDTTTNQMIQYNGTKWTSAPRTATEIVAASNSSQAEKDAADYVATGTSDQTIINSALSALPAGGGLVYLEEGTYTLSASINVPDNTTLAGAGSATIITLPNSQNGSYNMITNSDTSTGTNVDIQNLLINGNKANQSSGNMIGIYFNGMGSGSTVPGGKINNTVVENGHGVPGGIYLNSSSNNTLTDNTVQGNANYGIYLNGSNNNTVTGNTTQGNGSVGIYLYNSSNNDTVTGNTAQANSTYGIDVNGSNNDTVTGNTVTGNTTAGIVVQSAPNNAVIGNTVSGNTSYGIYIYSSSNNTISSNQVANSGGATANNGIYLASSSTQNSITGNNITDTSCSTTCYAINIFDSGSTANYLSNNYFLGDGTHAATINNAASTNTIYVSQSQTSNGDTDFQNDANSTTAFQVQNAAGTSNLLVADTTDTKLGIATAPSAGGSTLQVGGDISLTTLDASGTSVLCYNAFDQISSCGATVGSGSYIYNQTSLQSSSNFDISGNGTAATSLTTPLLQSAAATALTITGNAASTWSTSAGNLTIGPTAASTTLALDAGTSGTGVVSLGDTTAATINIGNNGVAHTIGIGATGAATLQNISIGTNAAGDASNTLTLEGGSTATGIQIGNSSSAHGIEIGTNSGGAQAIILGSTGTGSSLTERVGTGNYSLDGVTNSTYAIGASTTTGSISIGGTGQTGNINLGQFTGTSGTSVVNIANTVGTGGTQTINIGNSGTGTTNLLVGSTIAGTTTLQSAGGVTVSSLGTGGTTVLCSNAGRIGTCAATGNGTPFIQGGNTGLAATAVLGTTDGNGLNFITNNVVQGGFDTSGNLTLGNGGASDTNAAPTATFTIEGTGSTAAGGGAAGGALIIQGGAGTVATTGSAGGNLSLVGGAAGGTNPNNGGILRLDSGAKTSTGTSTINVGDVNATAINVGNTTNTTGLTLQGSASSTLNLNVPTIATNQATVSFLTTNATSITEYSAATTLNIATTNVAHTLHIADGGSSTAQAVTIGSTSASSLTTIQGGTASTGGILLSAPYIGVNGTNPVITTTGSNTLTLQTAGSNANILLTPNGTGSVVIGGTAPTVNVASAATGTQLTIQGGAATSGTNVGGTLLLQGGAGNSTGASGSVTVKSNTNNSTTAFQVQNASGGNILSVDTTDSDLTVDGTDNGYIQSWQTGNNSGFAGRDAEATVVANGYVYVIGGENSGGTAQGTVQYAQLQANGNVGNWTTTTALPGAAVRDDEQAVYANGYIYVIDGTTNGAYANAQNTVFYGKVNQNGTISSWTTSANPVTTALLAPSSVVYNGYLYVMGGENTSGSAVSTVYYSKLNADGSNGAWQTTSTLAEGEWLASAVVANGYVYLLGGPTGVGEYTQYASINSNGTLGTWNTSTVLPASRQASGIGVANGYIYDIGGNAAGTYASTYLAPLNANGTIGTWSCQGVIGDCVISPVNGVTLPNDRAWFGTSPVEANGYMYVIGGSGSGSGQTTVYYTSTARTQIAGSLDLVGLTGQNLSQGDTGGQLTAGDTNIVGTLNVQNAATFNQGVTIGGNLSVANQLAVNTITTPDSLAQVEVSTGATTNVGEVIQGEASQTADLLEFQSSTGALDSEFTSSGALQGGNATGSNIAGTNLALNGGEGTGTGVGGNINFNIFQASGTGGTTNNTTTSQVLSLSGTNGAATFKNSANSTTAFQVQNASGASIFNINTSATNSNLITNGDFEAGDTTTGWTGTNATLTQNTSNAWQGNDSMSVAITAANGYAAYPITTLTASTQYTFSFYGMAGTGTISTINVGNTFTTSGAVDNCTGQTLTSTSWTRIICTFTSGTGTSTNVYIKDTTNTQTFYIDGAQLQTGATATPFNPGGAIQLDGIINSPLDIQNAANSTTAFQVANASGTQVLGVDTTDSIVNIQGINSAATKGSNLVTGAFNGGNWSSATYWTLTATNATHTSTGNTQALTYSTGAFTPTASTTYEVIFTFINGSNDPGNSVPNNIDGIYATLGGVSGPVDYAFNDTYDALITTTGTGGLSFTPTSNWVGTISNVYVYKYVSSANDDLQVIDSSANVGLQVSVQGGSANDIFLGSGGTGDHDTVGTYNTALGAGSLLDNTDGNYDTAVGADSLQNTTGGNNPAGGTFGGYNTALGAYSLFSDTTGNNNTAIGADTMYNNTTGSTNVAIGVNVLDNNSTGSQNNAIGFQSLQLNTLGSYNVAMGPESIQNNTSGSWDTGIGNGALQGNTTGGSNVGIGFDAGVSQNSSNANTTGSWDTFIGGFAGPGVASSNNLQNATALGADTVVDASNSLVLGCVYNINNCPANTLVGIDNATPTRTLDVNGSIGGNMTNDTFNADTSAIVHTDASAATSYYASSTDASTDTTFNTTVNLTNAGLPTNGTFIFFTVSAQKGATTVAENHSTILEIGGTPISTVTACASSQTALCTGFTRSFTVAYINSTWVVVGSGLASSPTAASSTVNTADYAEWIPYSGNSQPQPGDVLALGDSGVSAKDSTQDNQSDILGVVSTTPYDVAGADDGHSVVIALTGRVPVNVSLENGPIEPGDPLAASSTPGEAMKATQPGTIIGTALEAYDGTQPTNQIEVQLHVGYDDPTGNTSNSIQGDENINANLNVMGNETLAGNLAVAGAVTTSSLSVSGSATVGNLAVAGAASVQSLTVVGSATVGTLTVIGNASIQGNLSVSGHVITGNSNGAITAISNGVQSTCTLAGNDTTGTVQIVTSGSPVNGTQCTINFAKAFTITPSPVISPKSANAVGLFYTGTINPTGFTIDTANTPSASATYQLNYFNAQ